MPRRRRRMERRCHSVHPGRACPPVAPHPVPRHHEEGRVGRRGCTGHQNRRSGSSVAHWCSLVWILSTRGSASSRSGHGSSVFTGDLLALPVPSLRTRWPPSPCGRLSRPRTTTGPPPHPGAISRRRACPPPAWLAGGEGGSEMVPTFTTDRSTGSVPSFSPAASPRVRRRLSSWPPDRRTLTGFGVRSPGCRARVRCCPAHIHQVWSRCHRLRGFHHWFTLVTPFRLACRTRTVWQCRPVPSLSGLLPPSPAPPGSGCPQLQRPAATGRRWVLSSPPGHMAPRGARARPARRRCTARHRAAGCGTRPPASRLSPVRRPGTWRSRRSPWLDHVVDPAGSTPPLT